MSHGKGYPDDPVMGGIIHSVEREARKRIFIARLERFLNRIMAFLGFKKRFSLLAKNPVDYGPF